MSRYALIYNKGYQETEAVTSVVTTKVKGASLTNNMSSAFSNNCEDDSFPNPSVLDTADLVVPPLVSYNYTNNEAYYLFTVIVATK